MLISIMKKEKAVKMKMLPDELIEEIIWQLPMKLIIRCGCVCKLWYSLIRTRNFISTHFRKTKNIQPIFYQLADHEGDRSSLTHSQISLIFLKPDKLDYMVLNLSTDPLFTFAVIGSYNGVLCLVDQQYGSNLILVNPSIRHSLLVPMPQFVPLSPKITTHGFMGFGFDDITRDYKIIRIATSSNHWVVELYSLNSNSWRHIFAPIPNFIFRVGQNNLGSFVNGRLHWVVHDANQNTNLILTFDLKEEETFRQLSMPKSLVDCQVECIMVTEFGESSIVLIHEEWVKGAATNGEPTSWVMREYGVEKSWQVLSMDELEKINLGCQLKDVKEEFREIIDSTNISLHLYVPSLELLDKQAKQY